MKVCDPSQYLRRAMSASYGVDAHPDPGSADGAIESLLLSRISTIVNVVVSRGGGCSTLAALN